MKQDSENPGIPKIRAHVRAAADWLVRSQEATGNGGSAAYWAPLVGWSDAYPETTGYIIPSMWRCSDVMGESAYATSAERMADWLLSIQASEGWFPGGRWRAGRSGSASVFNTAQILFGLVEAAKRTGRDEFRDAATRAAGWLVRTQDDAGQWSIGHYRTGYQPSYYAHVCWPLALYRVELGAEPDELAVRRALDVVLSTRTRKGTYANWSFAPGQPAPTHTMGYTIQGLLESALLLEAWEPYGEAARDSADRLLRRYEIGHRLAGAYDAKWKGVFWYRCLTGHCQLASTWLGLYRRLGDARFLNAAARALSEVTALQRTDGGIAGSNPLWGRYMAFRYPNWAAKFFIDAMLDLEAALVELDAPHDVWAES